MTMVFLMERASDDVKAEILKWMDETRGSRKKGAWRQRT